MNAGLVFWPVISLAVGGAAAYAFAGFGLRRPGWALLGLLCTGTIALIVAGRRAQGMEGLGYVASAVVFVFPAALGAVMSMLLASGRRPRGGVE